MTTYSIRPATAVLSCSPYFKSYLFAFDAAWEEFDTIDLAPYFWDGLKKLRQEINLLENPLRPYSDDDQRRLSFMVESLIQVRRQIDDRNLNS